MGLSHFSTKLKFECQNYKAVTGVTIDELFELGKDRVPRGQWSFAGTTGSIKQVSNGPKGLISQKAHQRNDDSDSDMPPLVTDSDSSEYDQNDAHTDSDSDQGEYDHDSVLDTDDEDNMRELLRECMDAASANPELAAQAAEIPGQYKSNSFLKALRNLAG